MSKLEVPFHIRSHIVDKGILSIWTWSWRLRFFPYLQKERVGIFLGTILMLFDTFSFQIGISFSTQRSLLCLRSLLIFISLKTNSERIKFERFP